MVDQEEFMFECATLTQRHLPGWEVRVDFTRDFGCKIGVAIESETVPIKRHGVMGSSQSYWVPPPWWKWWRKPVFIRALTPRAAIAELAKWAILNG